MTACVSCVRPVANVAAWCECGRCIRCGRKVLTRQHLADDPKRIRDAALCGSGRDCDAIAEGVQIAIATALGGGERDAYKRAKAENDERFMIERDEARHERDAAIARAEKAERERDEWRAMTEHVISDLDARVDGMLIGAQRERDAALRRAEEAEARLALAEAELRDIRSVLGETTEPLAPRIQQMLDSANEGSDYENTLVRILDDVGRMPSDDLEGDAYDAWSRLRTRLALAEAQIRKLLASAVPHPVEHPTMTAAWREAEAFLAAYENGRER